MPIYEYECTKCGSVEEVLQKFSDRPRVKCNHCSGKLHRLISQSSFHLKGTGWYATDYAGKSRDTSSSSKETGESSSKTSGETSSEEKKAPQKAADNTT